MAVGDLAGKWKSGTCGIEYEVQGDKWHTPHCTKYTGKFIIEDGKISIRLGYDLGGWKNQCPVILGWKNHPLRLRSNG